MNSKEMMKHKYIPVLFLILIWVVVAYPYVFLGKVPFPSTHLVNAFSPWSRYSEYASPVKNNAMPDIIDQIYPWKHFSIEQIKNGSLPFWNPYSFSGNPHIANYQSAVFSPLTVLFLVLPFIDAWSIVVLLQPLLAGLGAYLYMRKVGTSPTGALIAAVSFMYSGFMVVWMAYGTLGMAMAMLPFVMYFTEQFFTQKKARYLVGISLPLTFSFFSGHFQTSIYVALVSIIYIFFKTYLTRFYSLGILAGCAFFIGLLLTFPQLIPSLEFYQYAVRSSSFSLSAGIPFYNLITIIAPDFFGNPVTRNNLFLDFAEWQAFIGSTAFLLSIFAVSLSKKRPLHLFFTVIGVSALILSVASPLQTIVANLHIPVISTSAQSRIIILFSFCFSLLAGFGFDVLLANIKEKKYTALFFRIAPLLALVGGVWVLLLVSPHLSGEHVQIARKNFILPFAFMLLISVGIFFITRYKKPYALLGLQIALLLFVSFESYRYASKWVPFDPRNLMFPKETITKEIKHHIGTGRIYGNMGQQMANYYGLQTVEGYDPLYIQRYGEFIASSSTGVFTQTSGRTAFIDKTGNNTDRALDILGVTLLFHPVADTNAVWAYPVWQKKSMKQISSDGIYSLFRNENALPKASMFYNYAIIPQKETMMKTLFGKSFDYKKTLLLEEKSPVSSNTDVQNTTKIVSYAPNTIVLRVDTKKDGMLFLSDAYYPGWEASVDGIKTKIYRANYAFRAVRVPQGTHTVVFTYVPRSFYIGVIGMGVGAILLVLLTLYGKKKLKSFQR